jgi:uracil-DNA glycosylase
MSPADSRRTAFERREELKTVLAQARGCTRCPELAATRKTVVFGAGNADADLMFVGEAPGASEDEQGVPFVGRAGRLLNQLLEEIDLHRDDVFICNTLKCLRYDALVQLGDGTWERIGRLVRSRYDGEVMSVDGDGALVGRRVTGWHATPLAGRRVFGLTYASCKRAGRARAGIRLTGDHRILVERGYVPVEELRDGDRVAVGQGLSRLAKDVVCGTVLGDGCLQAASSHLRFSHAARQRDYARFKADLLEELGVEVEERRVAAAVGDDRTHDVVVTRTHAHRALRVLRAEFYPGRRKVVPAWIARELNPRMLAFWFMDGGYTRVRGGGRRPLAEIATNAFSDDDLQTLIAGLQRLGLVAKGSRSRLYFDVDASERLSEAIAPYVPPSMRHKLHPRVDSQVAFDPTLFQPGPTVTMYDDVEVEEIAERERRDTTFYCIDVEGTYNFVTAGGVVHNCRPPGNRDPLPVEIENCQEYLHRQVELIEPTVICTLGNFSTKLLRGDPTGITRLHGRPEVLTLGHRTVRLYPIFHPAAALYTPRMLETLREDFARIPELLAIGPPEQPLRDEVPELGELAEPVDGSDRADGGAEGQHAARTEVQADAGATADADQLGLF